MALALILLKFLLEVTSLRTGTNNQDSFPISIDYQTNLLPEWQSLGSLATPESIVVSNLSLATGEYINQLRWQLGTLPVGFRSTSGNRLNLAGLNGIKVELYHYPESHTDYIGDKAIKSTVTSNNADGKPGYYLFDKLDAGQYAIRFGKPDSEAIFTVNTDGSNLTDSDANANGFSKIITLNTGSFDRSWDAGIVLSIGQLSLGNKVWLDTRWFV